MKAHVLLLSLFTPGVGQIFDLFFSAGAQPFNQIFDQFEYASAQSSNFAENFAENLIFLASYAMTSQRMRCAILAVPGSSFFNLHNTSKLVATLPILTL